MLESGSEEDSVERMKELRLILALCFGNLGKSRMPLTKKDVNGGRACLRAEKDENLIIIWSNMIIGLSLIYEYNK